MKRFAIFKSGSHTTAAGQALSFSESDLEATVRVYNPEIHEAPLVVGHPKDNHPAYGWVGKLNFADGEIQVEPSQVDKDFAEMVQAGRFKKRSASFYAPGSATHPLAGTADHNTYYLRHVAFLGAQPPAVKGLKDVNFSSADEGIVEFEEEWVVAGILARTLSNLRDWLISTAGLEKADQILPKWSIQDLERHAQDVRPAPGAIPVFNEVSTMLTAEQIAALQTKAARVDALEADNTKLKADVAKLTADFSEAQSKIANAEKAATRATVKAQIEALVKKGKVTPAEVESLTDFAAAQDDANQVFNFGEGEKAKKLTMRGLFLQQLEQRGVQVNFGELSGSEDDPVAPHAEVAAAESKIMGQFTGKKA